MNRRSTWGWLLIWGLLAVTYFVAGWFCIRMSALVAGVSWVLYIPAGLSLTASLLWGKNVWPGVFAGELAATLASGQPLGPSLIMAVGNSLDAALAGWWFHDRPGRRIAFDRLGDVVQLLAGELLVLQPLSAMLGMLALTSAGYLPPGQFWSTASAWFASNIFAQFVIAPAVLTWIRWPRPANTAKEWRELAVLAFLTVFLGAFGPGRWATHGWPLPVALFFAFPLLVWASIRFVPSVAVTTGTLLGLFAFDAVLAHAGPFQGTWTGAQMVYLNVFMGVCLGTALFLSAALAQQRHFEAEQARLIAELSASASQVERLEKFVTFCAWTGRVRWKDHWVSVETFLHECYNVNVSHGISEEALTALLKQLPTPPPDGSRLPPA
jgi:integral membrane sensor domain MASE1